MKIFVCAFLLVVCTCNRLVTREFAEALKKTATWKVVEPEENLFRDWTEEDIKKMLGTRLPEVLVQHLTSDADAGLRELPENFDARKKWGQCIHSARNQGNCGSCWAFASTSHLSDRFCIFNSKLDIILSPQYMIECDEDDNCCNGGEIDSSFQFLFDTGTVEEHCLPYDKNCGKCREVNCIHYKCKPHTLWISSNNEKTKLQLYEAGPVESVFEIYRDFLHYKTGVYYHISGDYLGGHAIEVIGWGKEEGMDYWLCKNSWGSDWGIDGYFKIRMGDCNIDNNMIACAPLI